MDIRDIIRSRSGEIRKQGFKITYDAGITLSYPGVNIWIIGYRIVVKLRTKRGGWAESREQNWEFTKFLESKIPAKARYTSQREWAGISELNEAVDDILEAAKILSKSVPPMPKRVRSRSKLPAPHKFIDHNHEIYESRGRTCIKSTAMVRKCAIRDIVAIANNLKLIPAIKPGDQPWFHASIETMTGGIIKIVTDGDNYYEISRRSEKVMADWTMNLLSACDQELIKAAMNLFVAKMEEEK